MKCRFIESLESRKLLAATGAGPLTSGIVFPAAVNILDVTDYGATPYLGTGADNTSDDTVAIQAALDQLGGRQFSTKTLYFPPGVYTVSDTITSVGITGRRYMSWRGAGSTDARDVNNLPLGATLRLANNAAGFNNSSSPKVVVDFSAGTPANNTSYRNYIEDLRIEIGSGNPGAIGIRYAANNIGAIRNVVVKSLSPTHEGQYGLAFIDGWPGPALVQNVTVEGFKQGVRMDQTQYSMTFEHITLKNQTEYGIYTATNTLTLRDVKSTNVNPRPVMKLAGERALMVLLDGDFSYTGGGTANVAAIDNSASPYGGTLFARNLSVANYQTSIFSNTAQKPNQTITGNVGEFTSYNVRSLFSSPQTSLNLPVEETPRYENWNSNDWYVIQRVTGDMTATIQAAMNSGKPVIVFAETPGNLGNKNFDNLFDVRDTITVPTSVRKIMFMDQPLGLSNFPKSTTDPNQRPILRIVGDSANPLIIERYNDYEMNTTTNYANNVPRFEHAGSRTLVLKDGAGGLYKIPASNTNPGDVFFENTAGRGYVFKPGQRIWARQFNTEGANYGSNPVLVTNQGADLWILGQKTEGEQTIIKTTAGGRTEQFGGFHYVIDFIPSLPTQPGFINEDGSSVSFVFRTNVGDYPIYVQETRDGVTRTLANSSIPQNVGGNYRLGVSLYVGYEQDVLPSAPSGLSATAVSGGQIDLNWTDNSDNETGFEIERATDTGFTQNLTLVTTTAANVTSYNNTGLSAATTYYYRVRATNAAGDSANSNTAIRATFIPGDANGDGMVTIADLGTLASNWQLTGMTWADGDFTGDGAVTIADLGELATNWQAGVPTGPAVSASNATVATKTSAPAARPKRQPARITRDVLS